MLVDIHGHMGPGPGGVPAARLSLYAAALDLGLVLVSNRAAASEPPGAANQEEIDANLGCLRACWEQPRIAPLYWVRPGQTDSNVTAVAGALRTEPFVAALFAPAENGFDAADRRLDAYLAAVASAGKPAFFCVSNDPRAHPTRVYDAARRRPQLPIVLCACGAADPPRAAALDVVGHAQRQQTANLYLDTSHASAADVVTAVRALGADRILFGSDALSRQDAHVPRHIAMIADLRKCLRGEDFSAIMGDNAVRLLRLRDAPARATATPATAR